LFFFAYSAIFIKISLHKFDLFKMKLTYSIKGRGRDLVLLHGWGGSSKTIEPLANSLSDRGFRVISIDWPGSLETPIPKDSLYLKDYANLLIETIVELKLVDPVFVGHSFGGKVILKTALMYPGVFKKMVLIAASGIKPNNSLKKAVFKKISTGAKKITALPVLNKVEDKLRYSYYKYIVREMDYYRSEKLRETFKNILDESLDEEINKIKVDTLIIWGDNDRMTPLWMGEKIKKLITNSEIKIFRGFGHGLPLVNPDDVAQSISNFIKN